MDFTLTEKLKAFLSYLRLRLFGNPPPAGYDPFAGSPVRNKRGPNDRSAAVALAEPDDE